MSKRIGQTPFREVLPHSIAGDETVVRVADALDAPLDAVTKSIPSCLIFSRLAQDAGFANPVPMLPPLTRLAALSGGLAELPDEVLDLLAWQLHLEAYETAQNRLAKCEAIFRSVHLHRKKGTPWAVYHALETLLRVPATLSEWFQYGGEPYFFRARLNVTGVSVSLAWLLSAFQIIHDYKNVRSWLEWLETFAITNCEVRTGVGAACVTRSHVMLGFPHSPRAPLNIRAGCGVASRTISRLEEIYAA